MNKFHCGWYLIYTRPKHEKKVHLHLEGKKIDTFLPTKKTLRTWHDRRKYIDEPLFPSYVFVYLKDMKNYYDSIDAEGSLYYVKIGKDMARVSDELVNNIKLLTGQVKDLEVSYGKFQPGHRLVINKGVLTGLACEVVRVDNCRKLLVRVELLQRNILLSVPSEYLLTI